MSAGPGGGAWPGGSQGSRRHNSFGLPPFDQWKHLPIEEQLQKAKEWRQQQEEAQRTSLPYAPQSQAYATQGNQPTSLPRVPQPARLAAPPAIDPRHIEARPLPPWRRQTHDHATAHPAAFNYANTNTPKPSGNFAPAQPRAQARHARESSADQDYQRWESEVIHGRPSLSTGHTYAPRPPVTETPIGELYVAASPAASASAGPQLVSSFGAHPHASRPNQFRPAAFHQATHATPAAPPAFQTFSTNDPVARWDPTAAIESSSVNPQPADAVSDGFGLQALSIEDPVAESGSTVAIESSPASPQPTATAAAETHHELDISDVQSIAFPHLEDHAFPPFTAPPKESVANEAPTSQDDEAVSSKTAKNRAKRAKQKLRDKAKKEAAAAVAATATVEGATEDIVKAAAEAVIADPDVASEEATTSGHINESPASTEGDSEPLTKNQAKRARKKANKAAVAAAEAEENDLLEKMKEDNAKRKAAEEPSSPTAAKRVKPDGSAEPEPKPKTAVIPFPEKPAVLEERAGDIQFRVVNNDGDKDSFIILTGLKCIFQKQLPKMPKDYIARLVYDRTHLSIAIVKKPLEVVGGITYRPFNERKFAEIVFCAISSDQQVKGYGAHLMAHLKDYVKSTSPIMHFLTYADNYAIGYFKKQGFTKEITLDKSVWMGYIKDYEGGTIMQCTMLERLRYLEVPRMLQKQKECVLAKIRAFSKSHIVHQPPKQWKNGVTPIDPQKIEAIKNSGWSPEMDELARQPRHGPNYSQLLHLLNDMQNHQSAWPFLMPVNKDDVHDYYDVIKEPMDLSTMEQKLEMDQYTTPEDFIKDATLIFKNCRQYNSEGTPYTKSANKLEKYMWSKIKEIPEWSHLAENQGK